MTRKHVGGSFAPPLTDELLTQYQVLIESTDPRSELGDALRICLTCCRQWWLQPESVGESKPHPVGRGYIVALDQSIQDALFDHIPWMHELEGYSAIFDRIDPIKQKSLRDAAHHLLWHAVELCNDREPLTNDKLT